MFCDFSRTKHLTAGAMLPSFARQLQDQFYWNLKNALVTPSCGDFSGRRLYQTPTDSRFLDRILRLSGKNLGKN